jgi:hypothetical protein
MPPPVFGPVAIALAAEQAREAEAAFRRLAGKPRASTAPAAKPTKM